MRVRDIVPLIDDDIELAEGDPGEETQLVQSWCCDSVSFELYATKVYGNRDVTLVHSAVYYDGSDFKQCTHVHFKETE